MGPVLSLIQIVLGVLLVIVIIIQQKGTGLGSSFGGELEFYRTKRGAEKMLFYSTIALSVVFILFSVIGLII